MKTKIYKILIVFATLLLIGTIESYAQKDTLTGCQCRKRTGCQQNRPIRQQRMGKRCYNGPNNWSDGRKQYPRHRCRH